MQTLQFFSYPLQVIHYAQEYLIWMSISLFPLLVFLGLKQFYEGLGNTRIAMIISVVFNLLNILLNYLLIFGHWNLPAMGVEGASLATLISRLGMALTMFITVYSTRKYIEFVPKIDLSHVTWSRIKSILRLGIPSSMQYVFEVGAFSAAALMIGFLGAEALAAHQIAINIASITYMMATGLSMGASVLAAQAFGRKNMHEVKLAGNSAFVLVGLFMMLTALIFIVFNHALAGLYTQEQNVLAIAAPLLIIASIFQLADGFQAVGIGLLRGLSDVKRPTFYTFLSYWVICLPLGYVLGFTYKLGVYGIWVSLCVGLFVAAITLFYRFKNLLKNSI
jgi:multidrug resistance protein, MATE family